MEDPRLIDNLRDFLVHLPKLLDCEYNEAVSFYVWKVLNTCLYSKPNWSYLINVLTSVNWYNGTYSNALTMGNWKNLDNSSENLHIGSCCNRQCYPTQTVYYCLTCTINPLYEICELCFDEDKHVGHTYISKSVIRPEGKVCHCGNPNVFKKPEFAFNCKNEQNNNIPNNDDDDNNTNFFFNGNTNDNDDFNEDAFKNFNQVLDHIIDISVYFKNLRHVTPLAETLENSAQKNKESHVDRDSNIFRNTSKTIIDDSKGTYSTVQNKEIGYEMPHDEVWTLQIDEEDTNINYIDLMEKISKIIKKPIEYAISITKELEQGARSVTIVHSKDFLKLKRIHKEFESEGVTSHLRKMNDIFKQDLVEDLIHWLFNICLKNNTPLSIKNSLRISMLDSWNSNLVSNQSTKGNMGPYLQSINLLGGFLVSYEEKETFPWFKPWSFSDESNPQLHRIMLNYDRKLADTSSSSAANRFKGLHGSRFQYLIINTAEILSALGRNRLLKCICTMFTIVDKTKNFLAAQYLDIYLAVLYSTVASDSSGFKVSLMSILAQYTFQDPKVSNMAIRSQFIERIIRFAFTLMSFTSEDLLDYFPIVLSRHIRLPPETIKNRKTIICFKDLCVLMSTNTISEELLENDTIVNMIIECISQFNNILPLKRETSEHVEFENFDFSCFYFYFPSILIMTDSYIRTLSMITDGEKRKKLSMKLANIGLVKELELLSQSRKPLTSPSIPATGKNLENSGLAFIKENICNHSADVVSFKVGADIQNFFNPMSYFFKFVVQWSKCGRYSPLSDNLKNSVDFNEIFSDKQKCLLISESALSTLVLIGQINVGFWVRNGAPILHQLRMYTKYNMREFTFFSDVHNVQFSMSMADPNDFMVSFLGRWGLKNWANGVPMGDYPDKETTVSIVGQCILLLIQLLTDVRSLIMSSSIDGFERSMKTEIIHALCFQSCTYTQIMASIPEYITKHVSFDLYLDMYSDFSPPSGLTDFGLYSLKPEFIKDIDPYYIGLSSSKRYEAEKCIRNYTEKELNISYDSTFIPVKKISHLLKDTPYTQLYAITSTDTFGIFLKNTLDHIIKMEHDNLLPMVVHLIHTCVVNNIGGFMKIFWREYDVIHPEYCHYHSIGSNLYSCLLNDNFVSVHGKIREIFRFLMENTPHINVLDYLKEQTPSFNVNILFSSDNTKATKDEEFEKKKQLAKLRKEKLLRKLAKQQMKFIENNSISSPEKPDLQSKMSDDNLYDLNSGWQFPEDSCVFCKMNKDDDIFVYFSYLEVNICDHGINFGNPSAVCRLFLGHDKAKLNELRNVNEGMEMTKQEEVLRACGHGAHITCLSNHMKSISAAHNQTTKNIPVSFGFGLMCCPLCNGLCNSFLPKFSDCNNKDFSKFLSSNVLSRKHSKNIWKPMAAATGMRSACIFKDLLKVSSVNKKLIDIVDKLLTSTSSNIEMTLRDGEICQNKFLEKISNQKLLTIRLLTGLKYSLIDNKYDHLSNSVEVFTWQNFIQHSIDIDLLYVGSQIYGRTILLVEGRSSYCDQIFQLVKRKLHQCLLVLSRDLVKVNFYDNYLHLKPWDLEITQDKNRNLNNEGYLCLEIFKEYISLFIPKLSTVEIERYNSLKFHIHYIILKQIQLFLAKLSIVSFAHFAIDKAWETGGISSRDLDHLLSSFHLPNFYDILKNYYERDLSMVIELSQNEFSPIRYGREENEPNMIKRLSNIQCLDSFLPPSLIKLPNCLSEFFVNDEEQLAHKALKEDVAYCIFCGTKVHVQKLSSLHRYLQGECTNHSRNQCKVISSFGAFILVKSNTIYLSYGNRGSFYPAPYLNRHGEPDEDLKYNAPVYLNTNRYRHLVNEIILGNSVPHIVFRLTDGNSDLGGWETI
ncbi:hypothetical protein Kpol_478p9 [Vanderwaltozyma polyspora DSM 70294]|uniref:E3 ubiquitin-protein ligase n=1 Tax=Vanderwaltozyma polyspora (strain ATCC 22028 / DSM 70294 / BCRC 21397 / CBS 2163 / NBRC 10782 / NRRL Y-8283 / UCD 57-17) TaxID=436907 RepID=A7TPM8_VANPO|nr:uncharacterized protein Kpol_478p9 [Vanderwaltozyma polyspora DSM 70294]EDO15773.1 hypothetical protein Kpol_478p9 [Vanderwaltozyma polyspora DSM 70294]